MSQQTQAPATRVQLGPVPGCQCYGANTPDLEGYCSCQGISLRGGERAVQADEHDFTDADRHGRAIDRINNLADDVLGAIEHGGDAAAALQALRRAAKDELVQARRVIQAREARGHQTVRALDEIEQLLRNPADLAPDLIGRDPNRTRLCERAAARAFDAVTGQDTLSALQPPARGRE